MEAFILETLVSTGWRRSGETYWTLDAALAAGRQMIRRKLARRVRVLPIHVDHNAVAELPAVASSGEAVP
ncbi:MAG: hypothetical protein WCB27_18805 [Thermoguttaceae bacterium]